MHLNSADSKPEIVSLAQAAVSLAMVCLVLVGITGTVYKLIAPDGWIAAAFGRSLTVGGATLGSLLLIAACAWYTQGSVRRHRLLSEFALYGFAAAGALYLTRYLLQGGL
jgi:hypothetical protein